LAGGISNYDILNPYKDIKTRTQSGYSRYLKFMQTATPKLARLRLSKGEDKRLRAGHLWIYSNEVDNRTTPLKQFAPGQCVTVETSQGRPVASAYINPHSLICARVYTRQTDCMLDENLLRQRLQQALAWRQRVYDKPFYRLCYGESDFLPGVVIDRYGDVCVVQLTTAGAEANKAGIIAVLQELIAPAGIVLRNDSSARELEGLPLYTDIVAGEVPEEILIEENQTGFYALPLRGQKTGWFYDHRRNRRLLQEYARGKRVLDVFSYTGAWGMAALSAGAIHASFVDASSTALDYVEQHARLNGFSNRIATHKGDAFAVLAGLQNSPERFDIIVIDPPAFVKRRKDLAAGLRAYYEINRLALGLLVADGMLISASCSFHVSAENLLNEVRKAALKSPWDLQLIAQGHQAPDHPVHPAMPETRYLKAFFSRVLTRQ
jgi:23S rRNA (cytosine1962-C5)-methyltransferase